MSRSPKKVIRTAAEAVEAVFELCARYPEARADIVRALGGEQQLATVNRARLALQTAADALAHDPGGATPVEPPPGGPRD